MTSQKIDLSSWDTLYIDICTLQPCIMATYLINRKDIIFFLLKRPFLLLVTPSYLFIIGFH